MEKMTDRELIEAAAKAAGIPLYVWGAKGRENFADMTNPSSHKLWNPLLDDGDALRLAVHLDMSVEISEYEGSTYAYAGKIPRVYAMENWGDNKSAATRRAIVRAAAQLAAS